MLRIAVIGLGYWGPNLVRNFAETPNCRLVAICDQSADRLEKWKSRYPWVSAVLDAQEVFDNPEIDAVAIATPVGTHFSLAERALQAGKHVFIEKPLAATLEHALALDKLSREKKRTVMVDHVFLYTAAVRKVRELVESGQLGKVLYFDSVRINLGLFQNDVNVVWDLAPHDLSIMDFVLDEKPVAVQAMGARHADHTQENIAYIHFHFPGDVVAHFHVNWLAPVKIRRILVGGTRRMVVYDDIEPVEKVRIYDKGIDVKTNSDDQGRFQTLVNYRLGDVLSPHLESVEALSRACRDFVAHSLAGTTDFPCNSAHGVRVVAYLEAIQNSLRQKGALVPLPGFEQPSGR